MKEARKVDVEVLRKALEHIKELETEVAELRQRLWNVMAERDDAREERDAVIQEVELLAIDDAELDTAQAEIRAAQADARDARAERDGALHRLAEAEQTQKETQHRIAEVERERDDLRRTHPMPPTQIARGARHDASDDPLSRVSRAFVAWCARESPFRSRPYLFEAFAREAADVPLLRVAVVFGDADTFAATGPGAEHWTLSVDGLHLLVPQPLRADAFAAVSPEAYRGQATPRTLVSVEPAQVRNHGDRLHIHQRGHLSTRA